MRKLVAIALLGFMILPTTRCLAAANVDAQRESVRLNPAFEGQNIIIDVTSPSKSYKLISAVLPGTIVESPLDVVQEVDLNFDGNKDLLVNIGKAEDNEYCDAYIWDSASHRFVLAAEFSGQPNPVVNAKRFCIETTEKQGKMIRESCYVFQGTKLHCVETMESDYEAWLNGDEPDSANRVDVYLTDDNGDYTNVRNNPKGKTVYRLEHNTSYGMTILNPTNGWWQIDPTLIYDAEDDMMEVVLSGSTTGYWIHYTVVGASTRNYDPTWRVGLRSEAADDAPVTHWLAPEELLHPIDVQDHWVKMITADGKHSGWIDSYWLCNNPLTTCS